MQPVELGEILRGLFWFRLIIPAGILHYLGGSFVLLEIVKRGR
jgi:hypothetical protein